MSKYILTLIVCSVVAVAKDPKPAKTVAPTHGVKTPGILIPYASLKSEAEITLDAPPAGFLFTDAIALTGDAGIRRFDAKTNKPFEPSRDIAGVDKPCGGLLNAFSFVWTASCGKSALAKIEMRPAVRPGGFGGPRRWWTSWRRTPAGRWSTSSCNGRGRRHRAQEAGPGSRGSSQASRCTQA